MLLHEFTGPNDVAVQLVGAMSQLKSSIDNGQAKNDWTVDELLSYLKGNDIHIDKSDLFNMIKKPPLQNMISNIQGEEVIFKGQETIAAPDQDQNKKIVKAMAHSAAK